MSFEGVMKIVAAIILSVGGAGFIFISISSWIGKIWAQKILEKQKNDLAKDYNKAKHDLELLAESSLRFQKEKISAYKEIADMVAKMLSRLDSLGQGRLKPGDYAESFDCFNEQRIRIYGYLGMFAPQDVMDAQDELIDYLLLISQGGAKYEWPLVREKALNLVNEIRKDIGIDKSSIKYNGKL